jgi:1-acyl-sn-glycerol-3-phosphate acyltransferase
MTTAEFLLLAAAIAVGLPLACAGVALALVPWMRGPEDTLFIGFGRVLNRAYTRVMHGVRAPKGTDILPSQGPCIVVANHRSGADPVLVSALTRRWIHFLMAREYYEARGLRWLFRNLGAIPVNRDGNDLSATRQAMKLLRSGAVVGIFPQGGIREAGDPLGDTKAGVALLALRTGAPVVPLYIDGWPSFDSVLIGVLCPSRTRVHAGEPLQFVPSPNDPGTDRPGGGKPSREDLSRVTRQIVDAIRALRERALAERRPRGRSPRPVET